VESHEAKNGDRDVKAEQAGNPEPGAGDDNSDSDDDPDFDIDELRVGGKVDTMLRAVAA